MAQQYTAREQAGGTPVAVGEGMDVRDRVMRDPREHWGRKLAEPLLASSDPFAKACHAGGHLLWRGALVGYTSDAIRNDRSAVPPSSLMPGLEVGLLSAEAAHQDSVELEQHLRRDREGPLLMLLIEPPQRLYVVDELGLGRGRRVQLSCYSALRFDQRELVALDKGRVVDGSRKGGSAHLIRSRRKDRRPADRA